MFYNLNILILTLIDQLVFKQNKWAC